MSECNESGETSFGKAKLQFKTKHTKLLQVPLHSDSLYITSKYLSATILKIYLVNTAQGATAT